jgi:Mn2+/Fe2+ NRAMP family transporter
VIKTKLINFFALLMPGMLVAATGVGAGDLATASFTGSQLGMAVLWAVVLGGILKFTLTECLTRYQLVTEQTFIEGMAKHFGQLAGWLFLPYLLLWSFFVASALMSACGVTLHAILPISDSTTDKILYGIFSSLLGLTLVLAGGFKFFERVMATCVGIMFITVLFTAFLLWPNTSAFVSGLFIPSIPDIQGAGITWTVALMGGVGGTITILCYGYWIKERGRVSIDAINTCRIDLASGYFMTVLFGIAMVVIGSTVETEGQGADLLVALANSLSQPLGLTGKWLFLTGAFCAIFSSLLGVWQAVPYLFADVWRLFFSKRLHPLSNQIMQTKPYRVYLILITFVPMIGLWMSFKEVQKLYAVIGALFMPLLAIAILMLNKKKLGAHQNKPLTVTLLYATILFFGAMAWLKWQ